MQCNPFDLKIPRLDQEPSSLTYRKVEGFEHFLRPVPFSILRKAASQGPVIVVKISKYRSDVIIVLCDADPILVALPRATKPTLAEQASVFAVRSEINKSHFNEKLWRVLRTLWELVVEPVVTKLAELGVGKKSRVWWCPTAELCALPIHAAGPYRPGQKGLPDFCLSSYISNLATLIVAQSNAGRTKASPSLLVVA